MRKSFMSMIFAAALLFKCYVLSGALPMARAEDGALEQDTFASLLSDKVTENSLHDADLPSEGKMRSPALMVDPSLWRDLLMLHRGLPLYKRRVDYDSQVTEHKDAGQDASIPILRRDNMRCMVGRVYRPCWEA